MAPLAMCHESLVASDRCVEHLIPVGDSDIIFLSHARGMTMNDASFSFQNKKR